MKKILLLALASVSILASCNQEENITGAPVDNNGAVKVELGAKSPFITTKASVTAEKWIGTEVGIFGLSNNATAWDVAIDDRNCLINNLVATVNGTEDAQTLAFTEDVYYPLDNKNTYNFYGYYPRQETLSIENNVVKHTFALTGSEDILYSKATATEVEDGGTKIPGFNAKYIRKGGVQPSMEFKHLLTQFTFQIQDGYAGSNASKIQVNSIELVDVKNQATLIIADKADYNNSGSLTPEVATATFKLMDAIDNTKAATPVIADKDPAQMGESIMVLPGETVYKVRINIQDTEKGQTETAELEIKNTDSSVAFKAGDSHKVIITVYGLAKVEIKTSLAQWNPGADITMPDIN